MTTDNKQKILNYMSGKYTLTPPSDDERVLSDASGTLYSALSSVLPASWNKMFFEGMIAPNENSPLGVMYGGYQEGTTNNIYGVIILIDDELNPVKAFYEYSSGTKLRYIQYMKQAEDGTFYFIDDTAYTFNENQSVLTSQKRFVMVNNFTLSVNSEYVLRLRTSYIFSGDYVNFYCKNMYKDPNSSHYVFFGAAVDSTSQYYDYRYVKIFSLKINVGEPNVWTLFENVSNRIFGSAIATFDGENVKYRCLTTNNSTDNNNLVLYSKTYTGNPTSSNITFANYKPYVDGVTFKKQSVFLDYDNVYFVQNNQQWGTSGTSTPKYIGLYKYNVPSSQLTTIYEEYLGDYDFCNLEAIYIEKHNNELYIQYNSSINNNNQTADYYIQRLVNDIWKPIYLIRDNFWERFRTLYIKSNYNLLKVYLMATTPAYSASDYSIRTTDYNQLNYNGSAYSDYDSMIPKKVELSKTDGCVFARNLYNKSIYGNTTTSTVQIPNTYLNGIEIKYETLFSNTDSYINSESITFTKNEYENVLLNFINSISVVDEDTEETYPLSANYINQNINTGTKVNYDTTHIGKVRINYADGDRIMPIVWTGTTTKEAKFTIYVSSEVNSIDFLSEDESFTYITKKYNNLEIGKYYTITQKIRIE